MFGPIKKWDPFDDLSTLHKSMDSIFSRAFSTFTPEFSTVGWIPKVESFYEDNFFVVKADVPGIKKDELTITVTENILHISGERKTEKEEKKKDYVMRETSYGHFDRMVTLPENAMENTIDASYKDGVLTVKVEITKELEKEERKIEVKEGW